LFSRDGPPKTSPSWSNDAGSLPRRLRSTGPGQAGLRISPGA
jgi:hypothetical protein